MVVFTYYKYELDIFFIYDYPSGTKLFPIKTPTRKAGIKQYTRHCYQAVAATAVKSAPTSDKVMREVARKIKKEMNDIATSEHDSILRDTVEAVKHFSWDTVTIELQMKTPTLMQLLHSLVRNPAKSKTYHSQHSMSIAKRQPP